MKIAIIGGGASGLFCAVQLSNLLKKSNISIDIIEKDKRVGKKLLLTGNGKGNVSNKFVGCEKYNDSFVSKALASFTYNDLISFFESKGVLLYTDEEGRVYPRSETSNTILDALRASYDLCVNEILETSVERLSFENNTIRVIGNNFNKVYDYVVITTGSKAGLNNVPSKYNLDLISSTGHKVTKMYPALSPIYVKENIASLRGIRTKVKASIKMDDSYEVEGEVLFKDDALSGICMFELSTFYARKMINKEVKNAKVGLDLLKEFNEQEVYSKLKDIQNNLGNMQVNLILNGFFPKMLAKYVLDYSKVEVKDRRVKDLNDKELNSITKAIKNLEFNVDTNKVSSNCQIMVGGVNLQEVDSSTLESKLHPNLYFGGEVLNIDGQCGGFNLHFAFASGNLIAHSILKRIGE